MLKPLYSDVRWLDDQESEHTVDGRTFVVRSFESSADEFEVRREDGRSVVHYVHTLEGRHVSVNTLVEPDEIVYATLALADRMEVSWRIGEDPEHCPICGQPDNVGDCTHEVAE